jgi:DNA-binding NarL/FixJ family response regulator
VHSVRILIADDNQMIRRAMATLLSAEPEWEVCGEACDGTDTIAKSRELRPDLVLIDVRMPGKSGLETARTLRQEMPGIRTIIISDHDASLLLPAVREAGADGCVDKARVGSDLIPAIKSLGAGTGKPNAA